MSVMYVATLDILTEKGGFNPQAARAIGEAIDLEIARSREASASKEDVSECRRSLRDEIGTLRAETDRNFAAVRAELGAVRAELKEDIGGLRAELKEDINGLRAELKQNMSELQTEFKVGAQTNKAELVRWVFVVITGQFAMLLGVLYFFIRYFK
jgi:uncharacterized coiled-coil DUF342 family protein